MYLANIYTHTVNGTFLGLKVMAILAGTIMIDHGMAWGN